MRRVLHELLVSDVALTVVIPAERWYQWGAIPDVPELPAAAVRWISPVRGDARGTFAHQVQIWVYDQRGSYARIERLLGGPHKVGGVYPLLAGIADLSGPDGWITQADYLGDSGDDVNIDYRANAKYSSWQIAGRKF